MSRNLRGLSARKGVAEGLYEEVVRAAGRSDASGDEGLVSVAAGFMTGHAAVMGASSFYDFLRRDHTGKKAFVCDGTACLTSGRQDEVKRSLLERYAAHEIGVVTCLGHCHSNDAFMVSGEVRIAGGNGAATALRTSTNADRPALLVPTGDLKEYYSLADRWVPDTDAALKELELSGLRGRGGAGFPYHVKVRS
jgi:hypothetical protein